MISIKNKQALNLSDWLYTPVGKYTQKWVNQHLHNWVSDVFGYYAVQLGVPTYDVFSQSRIKHKYLVMPGYHRAEVWGTDSGTFKSVDLWVDETQLPFESESIDLLVLPHTLEQSHDPYAVFREAERVLRPEGRLIIIGFNPLSLWGWRNRVPLMTPFLPKTEQLISLLRLKDWLKVLSFELERGRFGGYVWPSFDEQYLAKSAFLDKAGDRWWPSFAGLYMLCTVKKQYSMRLQGPLWRQRRRPKGAAVVSTVSTTQQPPQYKE